MVSSSAVVSDTCTAMIEDVLSMKYEMSTVSPGAHTWARAGGSVRLSTRRQYGTYGT